MLDLYADWCVACKELARSTFMDADVKSALTGFTLLQMNMTHSNANNRALMHAYQVQGLPTILFFDAKGQELTSQRITGFMNAEQFQSHIAQLKRSLIDEHR